MSVPGLPRNVLSVIYSKADPKTKARLRVLDKHALADPLMPAPLKRGYAFGTGRYQKLYNTIEKRVRTAMYKWGQAADISWGPYRPGNPVISSAAVETLSAVADKLADLVRTAMGLYRRAVKEKRRDVGPVSTFGLASVFPKSANGASFVHPDREAFMDAVLERAQRDLAAFEANFAKLGIRKNNAGRSKHESDRRSLIKVERRWRAGGKVLYYDPAKRRAARVARRAARRLAA